MFSDFFKSLKSGLGLPETKHKYEIYDQLKCPKHSRLELDINESYPFISNETLEIIKSFIDTNERHLHGDLNFKNCKEYNLEVRPTVSEDEIIQRYYICCFNRFGCHLYSYIIDYFYVGHRPIPSFFTDFLETRLKLANDFREQLDILSFYYMLRNFYKADQQEKEKFQRINDTILKLKNVPVNEDIKNIFN